jgi:hypothetical protein
VAVDFGDADWYYGDDEWKAIASPPPLSGVDHEHLMLLHRSWLWTSHAHDWFFREAAAAEKARGRPLELGDEVELAESQWAALYTYYGFMWALIEAFQDRKIQLRGRLGQDVWEIADGLRLARNATFHVSKKAYWDSRLNQPLMADRYGTPPRISRIHNGLGNMILDELKARHAEREL